MNSPTDTALSHAETSAGCSPTPLLPVSDEDADREERIRHHRACMEAAQEAYERDHQHHDACAVEYHEAMLEILTKEQG